MRVAASELPEVLLVDPDVHVDGRGFFLETYHAERYAAAGIRETFVQDNHSRSMRGTVRGLHLQVRRPQGKLVHVIEGGILDVAVDVRVGSPRFGQWVSVELTAENFRQCYIPPGFAHGFAVLTDVAQVEYKCTDVYDPEGEIGIRWDDPEIGIKWRVEGAPLLSDRDRRHPGLSQLLSALPRYEAKT